MSGYGTRPTRGLLDVDANRRRLADALLGIPERVGGAFTGMAQQGLLANERFMSGEGSDQQFLPTMDSGGRAGALASFLMNNMAMGGPAGSLGAGPSFGKAGRIVDAVADIEARYPDVKLNVSVPTSGPASIGRIVVPEAKRGAGIGSDIMERLISAADGEGRTVALSPSADFGGSVSRLKEFYARFGFVPNSGRNKDFSISESMYRAPKKTPE